MATNPEIETLAEFWDRQIDFAEKTLQTAHEHRALQVHPEQLRFEYNLGKNVVCLATYRNTHSTTPDDFEPRAA